MEEKDACRRPVDFLKQSITPSLQAGYSIRNLHKKQEVFNRSECRKQDAIQNCFLHS